MKQIYFNIALFLVVSTLLNVLYASEKKQKKGFGFGAIPAVSYDSDLGFQYGAIVNLFDYGNGEKFPKYNHSLYLEYSKFSKGSGINRLMYDSENLIPKVRTTIDMTYLTDQMMDFYGFNGYQSKYNPELSESLRYLYKKDRNMFRLKADFQGRFGDSGLGWVGGYTFYNFAIDTVNIDKLGFAPIAGGSLYQRYIDEGLIAANEAKGGSLNYIKIGLKFDTRDQLANPMRGVWTEAVLQSAPGFINTFPHTKFALIHRQYFTLMRDLSFAYRIDYQTTVGKAQTPYFAQPLIITSFLTAASNQGLGGKNSLRGILRNRVVGDAVAFGNFEFRYKFLRFEWLNQDFYLGTNVFFDSGTIIEPIEIGQNLSVAQKEKLFLGDFEKAKFHSSIGMGLKIGWNENFIISADFGRAFDKADGKSGFYIGLNYLF